MTETTPLVIYLPRLFDDNSLGLQEVTRQVPATGDLVRSALEGLIQGPNGAERARNFQYALDRRTRILEVKQDGAGVSIELDQAGLDRVHGRPYSELVYWSIAYTMTEPPGITQVVLVRDGRPLQFLGDPPFTIPSAASRQDAPSWVRPRKEL